MKCFVVFAWVLGLFLGVFFFFFFFFFFFPLTLLQNMSLIWDGAADMETLRLLRELAARDPAAVFGRRRLTLLYFDLEERYASLRKPMPVPPGSWTITKYSEEQCKQFFRFERAAIEMIADFVFPGQSAVKTASRYSCSPLEAMCICLRLLSVAIRYNDIVAEFHRSRPALSSIFNHTVLALQNIVRVALVLDENDVLRQIEAWISAVQKVAGLQRVRVWGFIDGKLFFTTELGREPGVLFCWDKWSNGLKFQSVLAPNGAFVLSLRASSTLSFDDASRPRCHFFTDLIALATTSLIAIPFPK
jgi:hypothetical protein